MRQNENKYEDIPSFQNAINETNEHRNENNEIPNYDDHEPISISYELIA